MKTKRNWLDFSVGLFVLAGFLALLFLALKAANMSSLSFTASYPVIVNFDNIGGLKPSAAVRSAGVVVGRVQSVKLNNKTYQAQVTINIDKQYHFPMDTIAQIQTSGLLGEQYINLDPGSDETMLKADSVITMTQSALVLENLIGQFLYNKASEPEPAKNKNR
jgi:phospholipid/cholesterol/gamma-HCH transport system substrate-binding protein